MKKLIHTTYKDFFKVNEFVANTSPMRTHYHSKNPFEQLLWQKKLATMTELFHSIPYNTVLDIGCGDGAGIETIRSTASYTGIDISPTQLAYVKSQLPRLKKIHTGPLKLIQHDATTLPFKNQSMDLLIACDVLEHVLRPEQLLREMKRVVKPNGFIFVSIPNEPIWELLRTLLLRFPARSPDHLSYIQETDVTRIFPTVKYKKYLPNIGGSFHLITLMLLQ